MHIPDGYLSPSTCAVLYGSAAPFWYVAFQRMKRITGTETIPLTAMFAAFSFVVMMFNLPLPGGTTGHAVGLGIAAIVLGPWGAIASISVALAIQALFFGDGGLMALGANCFNMGVAGPLVAVVVYRVAASKSSLRSARRALAAGLAGYAGINASALLAAIEFGVQPLWFHDAHGVPLYCPYPLSIAIPAMMIGHLTLAGLAEFTVTAGVVRYLQTADVSLLRATAPASLAEGLPDTRGIPRGLWIGAAILLILSPLGILAAGSAWGEWSPQELSQVSPATGAPAGLMRLSTLWNAPIARYAPAFIGNPWIAYLISALVGTGLVILAGLLLNVVFRRLPRRRVARRGFVENTVDTLLRGAEQLLYAEQTVKRHGLLQKLDPRVKLGGIALLLIAVTSVQSLTALLFLFSLSLVLALVSRVSLRQVAVRAWLPAFTFGGLMAVPAIFLFPGERGVTAAAMLMSRVFTAATLTLILVLTTEWHRLLHALRFFRVPAAVVTVMGMSLRYVFLLLQTAHQMFEARRARLVGLLEEGERQRLSSATAGILLEKSLALSKEVHLAMQARGFRGEVYLLADHHPDV